MVHHNVCPLCSSEKISLHLGCTDHFISREIFDLYKCQTCNFVFTQDYPVENEIGRYYDSEEYISHSDTSKGLSNKIYRLTRNLMMWKKRGIIKKVSGFKEGTLLDIGSGTGHFAAVMKQSGWQVKGIEINERARIFSESQFGLEVFGPEEVSVMEADSFDCITLWHVLEHFHDPFKYASEIKRLLKPDGVCLIALPNCSSYDAEYYREFWAAFDVPRHLWHFDPLSFRFFADKAGFVSKGLRVLPFDAFYISILSEKYKGSGLAFIRGILRAIPYAFLTIFNKKRSSSLIYLLNKP